MKASQEMFTIMFLGEKHCLSSFFRNVFSPDIEFPSGCTLFYYPVHLEERVLLRTFAVFQPSLELAITPKEFKETNLIVILVDVTRADGFFHFVPFLETILKKKLSCPPVLIFAFQPSSGNSREVSFFSLLALKDFFCKNLNQESIAVLELHGDDITREKQLVLKTLGESIDWMRAFKRSREQGFTRVGIKGIIRELLDEKEHFLEIDDARGMSYLVLDEARRARGQPPTGFQGYGVEELVSMGLSPGRAREIIDSWEKMPEIVPEEELSPYMRTVLEKEANLKKNLVYSITAPALMARYDLTLEEAKQVAMHLSRRGIRVDLHETNKLVNELRGIMEIIVLFNSQPIFSYLPNASHGLGSLDNVSMVAGMFSILDIMRNQVFTSGNPETRTVEQITYGDLFFTICHGRQVKIVVHSLEVLSPVMVNRLELFLQLFEKVFENEIEKFSGDVDVFKERGVKLYNDVFTPLPMKHVNKNWMVATMDAQGEATLTWNQARVRGLILDLQESGKIPDAFNLEDVFPFISQETAISESDLLLVIPGKILVEAQSGANTGK